MNELLIGAIFGILGGLAWFFVAFLQKGQKRCPYYAIAAGAIAGIILNEKLLSLVGGYVGADLLESIIKIIQGRKK